MGFVATSNTNWPGVSVKFVGKVKLAPFKRQVVAGRIGSKRATLVVAMFFNSMNSSPPVSGWNMISVMTTGPRRGPLLALPSVALSSDGNCSSPVLMTWRPKVSPLAAAPKVKP